MSQQLSGLDGQIGQKLRLIREANKLSQRELARRAGVTNSTISMIEQGQVSPSVGSLARVLAGIPMSLSHFFNCQPESGPPHFFSATDGDIGQYAYGQSRILSGTRHVRLLPNQAPGITGHTLSNQLVWVVCGQVEATVGVSVRRLTVGEGFMLNAFQSYELVNCGSMVAEVFFITEVADNVIDGSLMSGSHTGHPVPQE